jgi:energy-coupling factor transporter ATP-binding protein EcfA2
MATPPSSLRPDAASWDEVRTTFHDEHKQGDHVAVVGPTDSGKSTLLFEFAKLRAQRVASDGRPSRVTVLGTKPRDRTLDGLGWPRIRSWPPGYGQEHVMVWPPYGDPATVVDRHRRVFGPLLRTIFKEGGQTVVIDEVAYFCDPPPDGLGLGSLVNKYFGVARSNDLSAFGGTTRPTHVPRSMWSEPKWLAIFAIYDHDDLRRLVEIGGNTKAIVETVRGLDEHEFLLIRRRGGRMEFYVSKVELKR